VVIQRLLLTREKRANLHVKMLGQMPTLVKRISQIRNK
jgi:hypothetical protein